MTDQVLKAACVLIPYNNYFFAVSRKNDPSKWGFPGGKVDIIDGEVESYIDCAIRETFEETGIKLNKKDLKLVYFGMCVEYEVATFAVNHDVFVDFDQLKLEPGIQAGLKTRAELTNHHVSPFANYNYCVFHQYFNKD